MNLQENIQRIKEVMGLLREEQQGSYSTIIIIGPQGVGKSTITNILGQKLQMPVIDSDEHVDQGDWAMEKTKNQGWLKRKDNEFVGMVQLLKTNLGKPVILDIGGSHGVWEGEQLKQILSMISNYPNRFLIIPTEDMNKSKEFLRSRLLQREAGLEGAIKYWEAILRGDESFANNFTPEDKEEYMKQLEIAKNGDESVAKYNIDRMQKRLDIIKSGNVNWNEFDINDKDAPQIQFKPDEFQDYSQYFINNMKNSGIGNHVIYNMGKDNEKLVDEIISKLV
jgi:ABC-type cobalamin/Fe3+-siderophores transport system ATPase subunit